MCLSQVMELYHHFLLVGWESFIIHCLVFDTTSVILDILECNMTIVLLVAALSLGSTCTDYSIYLFFPLYHLLSFFHFFLFPFFIHKHPGTPDVQFWILKSPIARSPTDPAKGLWLRGAEIFTESLGLVDLDAAHTHTLTHIHRLQLQ